MQIVKLYVASTDLGQKHFRFLLENVNAAQKEKAVTISELPPVIRGQNPGNEFSFRYVIEKNPRKKKFFADFYYKKRKNIKKIHINVVIVCIKSKNKQKRKKLKKF